MEREHPTIRLDDGTEKIFLNTKGTIDDVDEELENLLRYFETQVPQDDYTRELEEAVMEAIDRRAFKVEYMFQYAKECELRAEGRSEGIEQGIEQGSTMKLVSQVCRKLAKGKTAEAIAEELEESLSEISCIVEIAKQFAPDDDVKKIYEILKNQGT